MKKQLTTLFLGLFLLLSIQGIAQSENEKMAATQKQIAKDQKRADKLESKAKKQERKTKRHEDKMQRKEKKRERKLDNIQRGQKKLDDMRRDSTRTGALIKYPIPFQPVSQSTTYGTPLINYALYARLEKIA